MSGAPGGREGVALPLRLGEYRLAVGCVDRALLSDSWMRSAQNTRDLSRILARYRERVIKGSVGLDADHEHAGAPSTDVLDPCQFPSYQR
jgi:hypothetical protein